MFSTSGALSAPGRCSRPRRDTSRPPPSPPSPADISDGVETELVRSTSPPPGSRRRGLNYSSIKSGRYTLLSPRPNKFDLQYVNHYHYCGLEATLSDSKKKYGDKVNALLSAWEHVTNFIPAATPEGTQSLIEWVHKHTLKLILRGEWPKLSPATKTHFSVTLQRCASHLVHHPAASRCTGLIALAKNPWAHPALDSILNGQPDAEHEEEFCCTEKGELLTMRLKILCEDRCEDIAINLAAACVRSLRRSDRLRSSSDPQHVQFMLDVYIVLLYKMKRMQDILAQLKLMDLNDALELVQRLSGEKPTKYGTARVWRNSIKAAELVAQYLVTTGMVRPVVETGANVMEQILNSWALLHDKMEDNVTSLPGMIRKLIEPAESAQHIYIFCAVLLKHFGDNVKPLVIELYIRALTTDMNELENQKAKSDKEAVRETVDRMSSQFLRLADVVNSNDGVARECVLTAFSLHPTRACYDRIIEMAVACGKTKYADIYGGDGVSGNNNEGSSGKENLNVNSESAQTDKNKEEQSNSQIVEEQGSSTPSPPASSILSTTSGTSVRNVENGIPKIYDRSNDQLLKSMLKSPRKSETGSSEKCHLHPKRETNGMENGPLGELCFNCGEFTGIEAASTKKSLPEVKINIDRSLDSLILIKGNAITGAANYDEKTMPNQVLDVDKLGLTPQLRDDLAVVLNSPRYHMLSWYLDWKELHTLCEKYLENAEEMGNTGNNKELKYLNIDYSQFKDWPSEDDNEKDVFFGIEKGYEQWVDMPSDSSEQFASFQPAGGYKRSSTRRSLDDSSDSDSGSVLRVRRTGRQRKVHRLESSESDYESAERKEKHFRNSTSSVSDTDTNTQDSQTDSLGSDGFRRRENKLNNTSAKDITKKRNGQSNLTVETVSHFHMLVNENIRHPTEDVSGSDVSSNDIITLFSADMDENKRETIKGSTYTSAAPLIITEKRSDPAVLKSLRMFRPQNAKKPTRVQILQKNMLNKSKDHNNTNPNNNNSSNVVKFAPMLSTLNLNPKIVLTRADEVDRKLIQSKKAQLSVGDISSELINIQKTMPFSPNKNPIGNFHKRKGEPNEKVRGSRHSRGRRTVKSNLGKNNYDILAKAVRDSDILAKNVPGLNTLDMMVPPRVQSTVNVVQLSRNIPQSPNSGSINSGNTPPRNRTTNIVGNIQLPGTPSSGGHDSGVGMSPAGQTPPPRSSSVLHDVGDEANQPPDNSPTSSTNASTAEPDSPRALNASQRTIRNDSPAKSPSPSTTIATTVPITTEQLQILRKPDGTYQLASVNPNIVTNQRNVLTLQSLDESGGVGFSRQIQQRVNDAISGTSNRVNTYERTTPVKVSQLSGQNTGLPKFQQAFGKTIYTLTTDTSTVAASITTDTITQQQTTTTTIQKTTNLSKAVQTSVASTQASTAINVQSITNIPNRQLPGTRQILNIVQTASSNPSNLTNSPNASQTLTQLVQNSSPGGVIYTHKIPVTISTTNPSQLNIIPAISHTNSISGTRTPVVKLNIIRSGGTPLRQQNIAEAIQAALTAPRIQQQQQTAQPQPQTQPQSQQQQQQSQASVRPETLINSPIEPPNVSSTTLEQLREFESVLEQVKERSTIQPQQLQTTSNAATTTVQTQTTTQTQVVIKQHPQQATVGTLAQQLLIPTQTPTSTEFTSNGNTVTFQQQDVFPQKVSLTYVNQSSGGGSGATTPQKVTNSTPVVVVTSYCQPAASPALSVTSQSSSSPCVTPAPAPIPSAGKTPPTPSPKSGKKTVPKTVKAPTTNPAKASPIPKPQQKPQEDEQTAQRIYTILAEYAEQLRNSPDLNNKPAPRRRSNPPTNPSQSSKRKKSSSGKSKASGPQASELSPSTDDLGRTMDSENSSSGVAHVQDSPAGFSAQDEATVSSNIAESVTETRNLTSDSNDGVELNLKRRNLIFTEPGSGQQRAVIVQEAVQTASVSVSEALASVTGKMGSTAVFVPGTNYILPMNLVKGTQQFTIVSGGPKLLATVPGVRTTVGNTGVSNIVLQSFLNQAGKIMTQPQVKQVKLPTLQTISASQTINTTQNVQNPSVIIPQTSTSTSTQFTSDTNVDKINNSINAHETPVTKNDVVTTVVTSEASSNTIIVNKTSSIGLIQRNINDITDNQQICGVITSNPNLTLQGARLFNSTIAKLSAPTGIKTESVVCLAPASAIAHTSDKKITQEHQSTQADKTVSLQGQTIALTFAPQSNVSVINNNQQQQKDTREASTEISSCDKVISPKTVKRKIDDNISGRLADNIPRTTMITTNSIVSPCIVTSLQSSTKLGSVPVLNAVSKQTPTTTTTTTTSIDSSTGQYLVAGGPSSSDSQESPLRQSNEVMDATCKVGNGILCGNARLQEAWEPERKPSPDTPWRYVPTATNQLAIEPLKVYTRETDNSEVHSVLQIINKGQGIEAASGQVYQTNTKKYFMNHTLEPFQQYPNKGSMVKSQSNPRLDRELTQQRMERKAAALERELRLQKSLSEECEDLGVDEPSTSDLFPEADLLFDTNHSPSFDHLSQDASCSQPLGMKLYNASYFRPLDSSSGSRDTSPVSAEFKVNERRKNAAQRTRTLKETVKRAKRDKPEEMQSDNPVKHIRLSLDNLSQDEASNSNSDVSRLSSSQIPIIDNESSKDTTSQTKMHSRNGSKEGSPSSVSSIPSNMKLEMDLDSESLPPSTNANNVSATSSGDESLTLMSSTTADVTIPSPLSPIAGPLLTTHKYTYTNKKRTTNKVVRAEYLSWESPMSERTRSSSEDEDSSISESMSSQTEDNTMTNGLDDNLQGNIKLMSDHCTYLKKKDKLQVNARVVLNRADPKNILTKLMKNDSLNESGVMSSDKTSEPSDDEGCHATLIEPDCRARRSSLRGHVKKGCACCNGSPERPKKKIIKLSDHKLKKKLASKQLTKKR